jgi:hypothetical protein
MDREPEDEQPDQEIPSADPGEFILTNWSLELDYLAAGLGCFW